MGVGGCVSCGLGGYCRKGREGGVRKAQIVSRKPGTPRDPKKKYRKDGRE